MSTLKIYFSILLFIGAICNGYAQQLPERSTYDANAFVWNPAMTGINNYMELGATYKQQWAGFEDAPRTLMASFQYPFVDNNMSVGMYLMHDKTHPLLFNSIGLTYNYQLKLNITREDYLSIGILGTYGEYSIDTKNILTSQAQDLLMPMDGESQIIPNAGAGVFYTTNKDKFDSNTLYIGVAVQQLFSSDLIFDGTDRDVNFLRAPHANAILGASLLVSVNTYIEPSVWVNYAGDNIYDFNAGFRVEQEDTFWAAANFSVSQNFSVQGGIILTDGLLEDGQMRIGGLATYNIGKLGSSLGLGYEFYVAYRFYN